MNDQSIVFRTQAELDRYVSLRIQAIADQWQWGDWANAPRRADPVEERLANAQFVTNWLRTKAVEIEEAK